MTLSEALFRALNGRNEFWNDMRKNGATDEDLKEAVCRVFGIWAGFSGDERGEHYSYSGGTAPQFWVGDEWREVDGKRRRAKPTLSGRALLDAARRVLGIGQPKEMIEQMPLFVAKEAGE